MARPDKAAAVAELADQFRGSNAAVLTEYRGLTVAQLKTLRRSLGEDTQYAVVKNTLTKIAANEAGISTLDDLFNGPTAVAFITGDPVVSAKGLRDFAKDNPNLVIKGVSLTARRCPPTRSRSLRTSSPARFCSPSWRAPSRASRPRLLSSSRRFPRSSSAPWRRFVPSRPSRAVPSNSARAFDRRLGSGRSGPKVRPPHMYIRHQPN